jgi:hypothetical protein
MANADAPAQSKRPRLGSGYHPDHHNLSVRYDGGVLTSTRVQPRKQQRRALSRRTFRVGSFAGRQSPCCKFLAMWLRAPAPATKVAVQRTDHTGTRRRRGRFASTVQCTEVLHGPHRNENHRITDSLELALCREVAPVTMT